MAEQHLDLSVIICTRDRSESLHRVLTSLRELSIPPAISWELVVVNNGSSDNTPEVIERFKPVLPIREVVETRPGLSNARNCGIGAVTGDYILWTDDDVEVDPGWLAGYAAAIRQFPDGVVFAGRIIPVLEAPTPAWFNDNVEILRDLLAVRDFGNQYLPLVIDIDRLPFGANYAIRAREQRLHPYDPELGVSPGKRRMGEETKVCVDILNAGHAGYWVPDAKILHIITVKRQTEVYIRDYFRGVGETRAHVALSTGKRTRTEALLHHGLWAMANMVLLQAFRSFLPPRRWLPRLMGLGVHTGALDYVRRYRAEQHG